MVATLGQLHGRRVYLNMLAGGFKNDLVALNDTTPHDGRYERTVEYTLIVKRLLFEPAPVSFAGRYYQVHNLKLTPSLPEHLLPGMLTSGSSPAGLAAARAIGATAVQYPEPAEQMGEWQRPDGVDVGIRVGIIARDTAEAAWDIAHRRFPEDRKGQLAHQLATKVCDSHWHHRLSELGERPTSEESPTGLVPSRTTRPSTPTWSAATGAWRRSWPSTSGWASGPSSSTFPLEGGARPHRHRLPGGAWGGTEMTRLLQGYVTGQAEQRADDVAVVLTDRRLTYSELEQASNQLARLLKEVGCRQGDRICLFLSKSPSAIVGMLGVLKAGCIYVPIDLASPAARVEKILLTAAPRLILAGTTARKLLNELFASGTLRTPVGSIHDEAIAEEHAQSAFTRADWARYATAPVRCRSSSDAPAHILFTSGSTSSPKGVTITHANVMSFVRWATGYFQMGPSDRVSGHSPLHFDLSTFDIFGTLSVGAQLHMVPRSSNLLPQQLAAFIRTSGLTQWFSVPAALTYMAKLGVVQQDDFPTLRRVLWCGEVLPTPTLIHWMRRLPHVRFANLYGPTEATIASSYYTVPACPRSDSEPIPIGSPCDGEELLVLDEALRSSDVGEVGELYIGGTGLSPGYWRDQEKSRRPSCRILVRPMVPGASTAPETSARWGPTGSATSSADPIPRSRVAATGSSWERWKPPSTSYPVCRNVPWWACARAASRPPRSAVPTRPRPTSSARPRSEGTSRGCCPTTCCLHAGRPSTGCRRTRTARSTAGR
jgi:amino acid adenylation domain-containing protein